MLAVRGSGAGCDESTCVSLMQDEGVSVPTTLFVLKVHVRIYIIYLHIAVSENIGNKLLRYGWRRVQGKKRIQILYIETW